MQGAVASTPAPPVAEPAAAHQHIKTEEVISEAKVDTENNEDMEDLKMERPERLRTTSIDSDNRSDRSDEEDHRRSRKRPASPMSPRLMNAIKRTAQYECPHCPQAFDSTHNLDLHRLAAHRDASRADFKDFVAFATKKYPQIADITQRSRRCPDISRVVSHINELFRCERCTRNFPCGDALEAHRKSCVSPTRVSTPDSRDRSDFFTKLELSRSFGVPEPLTPPLERFISKYDDGNGLRHLDSRRDLADIQSIINVTSAHTLLQRLTEPRAPLESSMLTPPDTGVKDRDQEEAQDSFAAEFRRMKLRGEFPCRLCSAKFPNLRALKGHNRVHLNGPAPYRCNMCPFGSLEKASVTRHMREHNGDRPFECAVCNYAFTTKANCERHLRNRHAKVTREEVKRSIIYYPSKDPSNNEHNHSRDDVNRSLSFNSSEPIERRSECTGRETPRSHFSPNFITDRHPVSALTPTPLPDTPSTTPLDSDHSISKIKVKAMAQLKQIPEFRPEITYKPSEPDESEDEYDYDRNEPMNLVVDDCNALDLSKKKPDTNEEPKVPQRTSFEPDPAAVAASAFEKTKFLLAQQQQRLFDAPLPKIDPAFYATQLSQLYASTIPGLPALPLPPSFPLNPYFLQTPFFPNPTDSQELAEIKQRLQKEIIRAGLNLSGGGIMTPEPKVTLPKQEPEEEDQRPPPRESSPIPPPRQESPAPMSNPLVPQTDSVKMVIKNGVLMPKQKQRRYRTERPFSCSQCSARFTLRSNMERHVKQQHPQHWSIRRPSPRAPPPYPTSDNLADRVKYALLARHLERPLQQSDHSPSRRDSDEVADNEDEDDTLIIDEEDQEDVKSEELTAAHRAAAEILMASRNQELHKDFDLKIAGNLINKPVSLTTTPEKTETGTDPIPLDVQEPLPLPIVPTRSDEEEDEEGLVASTSEGNLSGSDENKSESDTSAQPPKKKSAYSLAPNRVSCPYCHRKFPWSSSLRRHVLTHTGQKPFKCPHCTLLFTTKSNCDRHLLRKHGGSARAVLAEPAPEAVSLPQPASDATRAAPERPFKCASCPTSTFSSLETLKKHLSSRHSVGESQPASPEATEERDVSSDSSLAFKCHLCEASFGDRGGALQHLASAHAVEYEQLVSKGALDATSDRSESADDDDRGKFPDHANRKVVCAFCVRRFWSAEDLRRHMRTHSGERPFACDLCRRRFTLKHSMLRHRKKHRDEPTDDEEVTPPNTPLEGLANGYRYHDDDGSGNEIPSNVNNNNSPPAAPYEKKLKIEMASRKYSSEADNDGETGGDLIGKLLGIHDKSIVNELLSSPDVAAKFLGVNK